MMRLKPHRAPRNYVDNNRKLARGRWSDRDGRGAQSVGSRQKREPRPITLPRIRSLEREPKW